MAAKSPGLDNDHLQKCFRQNNIYMSAVVGSQYGATKVAEESLIAHLDSQGKLTTLRRENKTFYKQHIF
jgi:hypothetical protein